MKSKVLWITAIYCLLVLAGTVFVGCAVRGKTAPQIDAQTRFALNLESQVKQANTDYLQFFKDAGDAQRAGQLTQADMDNFNKIGDHTRTVLQEADRLTKTYATNYDKGVAAQIGGLLAQVAADMVQLTTTKGIAIARGVN